MRTHNNGTSVNTAPEKEIEGDWFELADAGELFGLLFGALHRTGFYSSVKCLLIKDICWSSGTRIALDRFKSLVKRIYILVSAL